MAEYIDREKTQAYLCNNMMWYDEDGYIAEDSEKDKALWSLVNGVPTADVIERSKIDKAIEEMENEVKFWDCPSYYQEPLEVKRNKQAKANSYRHALEILKSNIGK